MKKLILIALVALCFPACTPKTGTAPATTSGSAYVGNDQFVIDAEKATAYADATFDVFLHLEKINETVVKQKAPAIHEFAEYLRQPGNARAWLKSARALTKAYKANRSNETKVQLNAILSTIAEAATQAKTYTTKLNQGV